MRFFCSQVYFEVAHCRREIIFTKAAAIDRSILQECCHLPHTLRRQDVLLFLFLFLCYFCFVIVVVFIKQYLVILFKKVHTVEMTKRTQEKFSLMCMRESIMRKKSCTSAVILNTARYHMVPQGRQTVPQGRHKVPQGR